jgi:dynein heavy chain
MERLLQGQNNSQIYSEYQKEFNLEETKFDLLDSVLLEVKSRQMLWDSFQDWRDGVATWYDIQIYLSSRKNKN